MKSLVDALEATLTKSKAEIKGDAKSPAPDSGEASAASTKKGPPKSARRRSREFALQAIYQWLVAAHSAGELDAQFSEAEGFKRSDVTLFSALMRGTINESRSLIVQQLKTAHQQNPAFNQAHFWPRAIQVRCELLN